MSDGAGVPGIENARLYEIAKTREIWSVTTADVMGAMLEMSGESVLEVIAEHVGAFIDVDLVVVAVSHGDDEFRVTTARGPGCGIPAGPGISGCRHARRRALATRRAASAVGEADQAPVDWQPGSGPTVAIPLYSGRGAPRCSHDLSTAGGTGVHRRGSGHGLRVRRPGHRRHRDRQSERRPTPPRNVPGSSADRARPARPCHPAPVRGGAVAAGGLGDRGCGGIRCHRGAGRRHRRRDQRHPHDRVRVRRRPSEAARSERAIDSWMWSRKCRPACRRRPASHSRDLSTRSCTPRSRTTSSRCCGNASPTPSDTPTPMPSRSASESLTASSP